MAVPIHQDNYFWNINNSKGLTVWIALDKCTKKNGALFYFTKSQLKGLLSHKPSFCTRHITSFEKHENFKKI